MTTYNKHKVIVGLSGGVDSAVAAYLLKKQGYDVSACYLQCWNEPGCRADQDREDALKVALALGLPFQVIDFSKEYKEKVLNYFYEEYKAGRTPNPDILCNSVVKFGLFYEYAISHGFDYIATGHYSKIIQNTQTLRSQKVRRKRPEGQKIGNSVYDPSDYADSLIVRNSDSQSIPSLLKNNHYLAIPKDVQKDQTYFLYQIPQDRLEHILFPLEDHLKSEVREIARQQKLPVADKKDSMGICFVGDINVPVFLKEKFGVKKGEVQLSDGTVIGEHEGHYLFTVGRRGNWRFNAKTYRKTQNTQRIRNSENQKFRGPESDILTFRKSDTQSSPSVLRLDHLPPLYVIKIKPKENVVVVGEREEASKEIFNFQNPIFNEEIKAENTWHLKLGTFFVRIRNTGELLPAKLTQLDETTWQVRLEKPEFGISPGQSAVVYKQLTTQNSQLTTFVVVGGGVIA